MDEIAVVPAAADANLHCPGCSYSLRGLAGEFVICPECGARLDVAKLVTSRWTGRWFRAPMYTLISLPVVSAFFATVLFFVSFIAVLSLPLSRRPAELSLIFAAVFCLAGWAATFVFVVRRFGSREGLWLALLAHAIFLVYLAGVPFFIVSPVRIVLIGFIEQAWYAMFPSLGLLIVSCVFVAAGYLGERFVAHRCIRQYLRKHAAAATMDA